VKFSQFLNSSNEKECSRPLRALIDLAAFKNNVAKTQSFVGNSNLVVVVKADAYGHGLLEIARAANGYQLAVAIPEELHQLRAAGIENKVWVLEGFFTRNCLTHTQSVAWCVHSLWQLELLKEMNEESLLAPLEVCIKLDTGMHRLGFNPSEFALVKQYFNDMPQLNLSSVMSHFSMSDQADNPQVYSQIKHFDEVIRDQNWPSLKQSMANSGAICFYPESYRDLVRPGIMLYGGSPAVNAHLPVSIEPVMSFLSAVIAVHHVKKGDSVGYGGTWIAEQDSVIATVAVGYADGYPRHAPNGTPVAVLSSEDGVADIVSLAGRVSMDMITVDVSSVKHIKIGEQVELWGKNVSVDLVAELSGTISYELLTSVSKRVPRIYKES
tara:strand:- start:2993 stop:4138 length:1146 start_codon:yes stop_codon:yes gene_type:complete